MNFNHVIGTGKLEEVELKEKPLPDLDDTLGFSKSRNFFLTDLDHGQSEKGSAPSSAKVKGQESDSSSQWKGSQNWQKEQEHCRQ